MTGLPTLALVGEWLTWLPTHARWAGVVAGPLAIVGYLAGSVPVGYFLSRRRLRRQLDAPGLPHVGRGPAADPLGDPGAVASALLSAGLALLVATVAWDIGLQVAPRSAFSAIGTFANQAVGAWVSIALWTGAAAVVGHVAPVWTRFRGGSGVPPAVALAFVYTPLLLSAGAAAFLVAQLVTREPRRSLLAALPVVLTVAYVTWILDVQGGWGVTNGPEVTLWAAVVAGVLAARNLRPADVPTT